MVPTHEYLPTSESPNIFEAALCERGIPHNIHNVSLCDCLVPRIHEELSVDRLTRELCPESLDVLVAKLDVLVAKV
jgi:hypothetical protein